MPSSSWRGGAVAPAGRAGRDRARQRVGGDGVVGSPCDRQDEAPEKLKFWTVNLY